MYHIAYESIYNDSQHSARQKEWEILDRSVMLLETALRSGKNTIEEIEAVHFSARVWTAFLEDLARDDNQLSKESRANLISIGIWVLRELEAVRSGKTEGIRDIIDITHIIREGLT